MVAGLTPLFTKGYALNQMSASLIPASACDVDDRVLVMIYLAGANDIINTAVPLNHFAAYANLRPDLYLQQSSLIELDSTQPANKSLGLHPSLTGLKGLYDAGKLSIVQRTGYPSPNRSHFVSEDILLKGLDGTVLTNTAEEGWMGRFLKDRYPTYNGLPFSNEQDPLGLILGDAPSTGFHTLEDHSIEINLSGQDPSGFYNIISTLSGEPFDVFPNTEHGHELEFMSYIERSTQVYSERISSVFNGGNNSSTVYPATTLGNQLKTIARFISGGSRTKVFMARKGGWDNHVNMVDSADRKTGTHASLLKDMSDSILAFQNDLTDLNISDRVVTVVFSEFSRKVIQNGSLGTDHGTLSSMFVIGDPVIPGIKFTNFDLTNLDSQGAIDASQLNRDYRNIYTSILQQWMGASNVSVENTFPYSDTNVLYNPVTFINAANRVDPTCYFEPIAPVSLELSGKVYLEGFLDPATGEMTTTLADNNLIPHEQPFFDFHSYSGDEVVNTFPVDTVDWILVEFWNAGNLRIARKAALLRKDGRIMDLNGDLFVTFSDLHPEPVRVAFLHRTHMAVLSTSPITVTEGATPNVDLTTQMNAVEGTNQLKDINGKFAMLAGDSDQNGVVNGEDYNYWKRASYNGIPSYNIGDIDGSGLSSAADLNLWEGNRSRIGNPLINNILKR